MAFCCCLVVSSTFGHWSCVFNFGDAWWQKLQSCLNSSHCPMWQKVTSRILVHEGEWLTWLKPLGSGGEHLVECKEALLEELHVSMALPAALCSANIFDPTAEWASGLPSSPASPPNPLHEALIKADGTSKKTLYSWYSKVPKKKNSNKSKLSSNVLTQMLLHMLRLLFSSIKQATLSSTISLWCSSTVGGTAVKKARHWVLNWIVL